MGPSYKTSRRRLFYDQSSAACHALYHTSEKTRAALLAYAAAYYTGKTNPTHLQDHFGMDAEQLGQLVRAYAVEATRR